MATRKAIKEAFVAEMNAILSQFSIQITTEHPNSREEYPAVVYSYADREVPMNNKSAPTKREVLSDGTIKETYSNVMEGVFSTEIVDSDDLRKEDIYNAVREGFEAYEHPLKDSQTLNTDAHRVMVDDSSATSFEDRTPRGRGDVLDISIFHTRHQTQTLDPIDTIEQDTEGEIRTIN